MIYAEADILFLLLLFFVVAVVVSKTDNSFCHKKWKSFLKWHFCFLKKKFKFLRMAEISKKLIQMYY